MAQRYLWNLKFSWQRACTLVIWEVVSCSVVHKYQQFWRKLLPPSSHRREVYPEDNNHKLLPNVVPIHQTTRCHKSESYHLESFNRIHSTNNKHRQPLLKLTADKDLLRFQCILILPACEESFFLISEVLLCVQTLISPTWLVATRIRIAIIQLITITIANILHAQIPAILSQWTTDIILCWWSCLIPFTSFGKSCNLKTTH